MENLYIPSKIKSFIDNKTYNIDNIGMSGSQVLIFEDMVLKIQDNSSFVQNEVDIMQWLEGRISVPKVIGYKVEDKKSYLLMSKIDGKMACDEYYLKNPHVLLEGLACGLKMLWDVNIEQCPYMRDLDTVLHEANMRVKNNLVDLDNVESTTFGKGGFESPKHLIEWLENNKPSFEPVFSHGDFCLPNIFMDNGYLKGFIDLGRAGIGDKWNDIALCYRSLKHTFDGTYGGKVYKEFKPEMLFEKLGIDPDWDKINYYLLLDELF